MARLSWLQRLYWQHLSKPAAERQVFLHVLEQPIHSILEIGLGSGDRISRVVPLCIRPADGRPIRYTAIDPFESLSEGHLSLKSAHRLLTELGLKAQLIPGEPASAVARVAHSVLPSDLILIDGYWSDTGENGQAIRQWLPRLCHSQSAIFASSRPGGPLERIEIPSNALPLSNLPKVA